MGPNPFQRIPEDPLFPPVSIGEVETAGPFVLAQPSATEDIGGDEEGLVRKRAKAKAFVSQLG